jgi:hypothetical protein
MSELGL